MLNKDFLLVFICIYLTYSSVISSLKIGSKLSCIAYFILLCFLFFKVIIVKKMNFKILVLPTIMYVLMLISILLTMLSNSDYTGGYFLIFMSLTCGYMMIYIINRNDFYEYYIKSIIIISIYSIILQLCITIIGEAFKTIVPSYVNYYGTLYRDFGLSFIIDSPGYIRIIGIFGESGMYQVFIIWGLMFELFLINRDVKMKNVILMMITLILTFSTIGIIQGLILVGTYLISNKNNKNDLKKFLLSILIIFILITILAVIIPEFAQNIINASNKFINKESSYIGRLFSIISNIKVGISSPLTGLGITNGFYTVFNEYLGNVTRHNTSTTTAFFVLFGVGYSLISLVLCFILINKNKYQNVLVKIILVFILLLNVNSQLLIYDQMFYIISFSGFMSLAHKKGGREYEDTLVKSDSDIRRIRGLRLSKQL